MANISELPDELLIKILSFLSTNFTVSTSVLSKRWKFLWMWSPKIEYIIDLSTSKPDLRDFINKNLPIHRAPVIESLCIKFNNAPIRVDIKQWVQIVVSRCVPELSIHYRSHNDVLFPRSLYTCKSLVTLKLVGDILVDVPPRACLPSLKTCQLRCVKYSNEDSLRRLLSHCPVLEDLIIDHDEFDNVKAFVVISPSLQRLSMQISGGCSCVVYVIDTPSLKYFKVRDYRDSFSYLIEDMPKLEEADIIVVQDIEKLLESITYVKRLSLHAFYNSKEDPVYCAGIVFDQLEHLTLCIDNDHWSNLLVRLLKDSPKLRVLNLYVDMYAKFEEYQPVNWNNEQTSVPGCLSLETFEFAGYKERPEERYFLSFLSKYARRLKVASIF